MRAISFAYTTAQFLNGSKDVTRRMGWASLVAGTRLRAVEKSMGIRKGGHQVTLGEIEVVSVSREELRVITAADVRREGFPDMTPAEFVAMYCKSFRCQPESIVTRIEFRRIETVEFRPQPMRVAAP